MDKNVVALDINSKKLEYTEKKIAVQMHVFYPEIFEEMYSQVKKIPYDFDCYISTDSKKKKNIILKLLKSNKVKNNINVQIDVFDNKGRDILPFIRQMHNVYRNYDYVCHVHSKKSKDFDYENRWRKYLLFNLFGSNDNIKRIFYLMDNLGVGMVFPKTYDEIDDKMLIGSNEKYYHFLCDKFGCNYEFLDNFPSGSMFWAKTDSIHQIFENTFEDEYSEENGQVDGTLAHAMERFFSKIVNYNNYDFVQIINKSDMFNSDMNILNRYDCDNYYYKRTIFELENQIRNLKSFDDFEEYLLKNKNDEISSLNNKIMSIINSKSWIITKPMRAFMSFFKKDKCTTTIITNDNIDISNIISSTSNTIHNDNTNNIDNINSYISRYEDDIDFSSYKTDIKTIAFYLPQFHTFPENDAWWGKGFTEWTNTKKSMPRFKNHYQPRIPHDDFGYYTLDNSNILRKQINLAKRHGIYGFSFYYYWFSGKRLMEKPIDIFLNDKSLDFPFCLCWANENWTRTWDGLNKDILIKQNYSEKDNKNFIVDIEKYLRDDRYIKIDNKPLILVYNPTEIPDFEEMVKSWRKYAKKLGIGDLYIISRNNAWSGDYSNIDFVDGEFDFAPNGFGHPSTIIKGIDDALLINYKKLVDDIEHLYINQFSLKPFYYSCTMGWDNSPRRKKGYKIFVNYNLDSYYKWLRIIIDQTRKRNKIENRIIFVNAWNEWGEGTYLEPDKKYGYANINTLSKAIFDLPLDEKK